jgi:hypothetical protein
MKSVGWSRLDSSESEYRPVVGCCQHGNEPLAYIKLQKFLDHLRSLEIRLLSFGPLHYYTLQCGRSLPNFVLGV